MPRCGSTCEAGSAGAGAHVPEKSVGVGGGGSVLDTGDTAGTQAEPAQLLRALEAGG